MKDRHAIALDILKPEPAQRDACSDDILLAIQKIEKMRVRGKTKPLTPTQYRGQLQRLAKALKTAINETSKAVPAGLQAFPPTEMLSGLCQYLGDTEQAIRKINKYARKGSPRVSAARKTAVREAYLLLAKYNKQPTKIYETRWHKLALGLLGFERGNLRPAQRLYWRLERLIECRHAY